MQFWTTVLSTGISVMLCPCFVISEALITDTSMVTIILSATRVKKINHFFNDHYFTFLLCVWWCNCQVQVGVMVMINNHLLQILQVKVVYESMSLDKTIHSFSLSTEGQRCHGYLATVLKKREKERKHFKILIFLLLHYVCDWYCIIKYVIVQNWKPSSGGSFSSCLSFDTSICLVSVKLHSMHTESHHSYPVPCGYPPWRMGHRGGSSRSLSWSPWI